ncbi:hypothetical protein FCM35_KLT22394 [Carex littledalei]|uniref:Uncharacterized protein n=1 Tax=Carex littledalei TaxID=544730 RepID=A0A833VBT3_9POAL|nr:hypothetical protein FCM35_KLT22394 [Carex littledalei]
MKGMILEESGSGSERGLQAEREIIATRVRIQAGSKLTASTTVSRGLTRRGSEKAGPGSEQTRAGRGLTRRGFGRGARSYFGRRCGGVRSEKAAGVRAARVRAVFLFRG